MNMKPLICSIFIATLFFGSTVAVCALAYNPDMDLDTDGDGLTDYEEKAIYQTFWYDKDTDKDGYDDGLEVKNNYSPKQKGLKMFEADTDNDGLNDAWEIKLGSNLMIRDTDNDGYLDGMEVNNGYSPTDPEPKKIERLIKVDVSDYSLSAYHGDTLLETFAVSTGIERTPTPLGEFKVLAKIPVKWYLSPTHSYPNTKWNLKFTIKNGLGYYIHSAYWHDKFGWANVSGGCVNVRVSDMERLYNWASVGTKVIIQK